MAITAAQYTSMWSTSNSDADYLTSDEISELTASFTNNDYINDKATLAMLGPVMHQIQKMQDELTYLRGLISTNKDKVSFPGLGTSNSTALAGDTTTISSSQASAITANTAKTSMTIGTGATQAMAGNTTIPPISVTGLPLGHTFDVQVRVMPPAKGAKKGTVVLTWSITDAINRVTYSSNQTLI